MKTLYLDVIPEIQEKCPELLLCGSCALIVAEEMDSRKVADIDFVINKVYTDKLEKILSSLRRDTDFYGDTVRIEEDGYESWHGTYKHSDHFWQPVRVNINVLVFDDDIDLESKQVTYKGRVYTIQDIDTILHFKRKYNRIKDKKDLENIANKCIENILSEPEEA